MNCSKIRKISLLLILELFVVSNLSEAAKLKENENLRKLQNDNCADKNCVFLVIMEKACLCLNCKNGYFPNTSGSCVKCTYNSKNETCMYENEKTCKGFASLYKTEGADCVCEGNPVDEGNFGEIYCDKCTYDPNEEECVNKVMETCVNFDSLKKLKMMNVYVKEKK